MKPTLLFVAIVAGLLLSGCAITTTSSVRAVDTIAASGVDTFRRTVPRCEWRTEVTTTHSKSGRVIDQTLQPMMVCQ